MNDVESQALLEDHPAETDENIYCEALANTLRRVTVPVTVGFYAPWGRNKRRLLDKIEIEMKKHKSPEGKDGRKRRRNPCLKTGRKWCQKIRRMCCLLWLALRISLYYPVSMSEDIKSTSNSMEEVDSIRYIFINFDAWEYVGCDRIWAGLVTTLLDEIEGKNKFHFSLFRASGCKAMEKGKKKKWRLRGCGGFVVPIVSGLFVVLMLYSKLLMEDKLQKKFGVVAGVLGLKLISPLIHACKNFCFTLKKKLKREINKQTLSAQLGFMHFVKEEVKTITKFLQFMEFQEDREIRVVLKITNLDKCTQDKVVDVLDAINILLSDKDAPFISILAADPSILVECIQKKKSTNGYLYLDRNVSLPFSLPRMTPKDKSQWLNEILNVNHENCSCKENIIKVKIEGLEETNAKLNICKALKHNKYIPGNSAQLERVVNTVLTIWSMTKLTSEAAWDNVEKIGITEVIDWVVLASCWPCRLSWILQCEEDNRQQRNLQDSQAADSKVKQDNGRRQEESQQGKQAERDGETLLEIYDKHESELADYKEKPNIQSLLELDGDPDLFKSFLVSKKHFTAKKVRYFAKLLVNLDYSLKRPFELLRGRKNIQESKKKQQEYVHTCPCTCPATHIQMEPVNTR